MRFGNTISVLAVVSTFALALPSAQAAPHHGLHHSKVAQISGRHMSLRFAHSSAGSRNRSRGTGMVGLVGDRESGLGFYALPAQYRIGAQRARDRKGDAIRYAIGAEMGNGYYYGAGGEDYGENHHHAMFNPVDGYGTPFFAGYYGPAGDPDEERGPFGNPYD